MIEYQHLRAADAIEPVRKEEISRVPGSMALKMADHNYIAMLQSLASMGSPIVINNACASWNRLAGTFIFGNARAYIGTIFDVLDAEAQEVVRRLFGNYIGKILPVALWRAQNDVAADGIRRPYAVVGCHFQRIRPVRGDHQTYVLENLRTACADWKYKLANDRQLSKNTRRTVAQTIKNLETQIKGLEEL